MQIDNRWMVSTVLALILNACASAPSDSGTDPANDVGATAQAISEHGKKPARRRLANDVVLVHGAWADGSSWSGVIPLLQDGGFTVQAVQLREQSVADDAALVRHAIAGIPRPVVVAGHSYGGYVMSEATAGAANVVGLAFVAAFAPDQGESIAAVSAPYPTPPTLTHLVVDDQGNATIDTEGFVQFFASGVPAPEARVLAAVQHPIAVGTLGTPAGPPGWRTIPSYYQVSLEDQAIDPGLERFFAQRMGATTIELHAGHLSLVSHPRAVAGLIERAAAGR
jgi:pimeloyl-ACP methyl ester carboxylesterase